MKIMFLSGDVRFEVYCGENRDNDILRCNVMSFGKWLSLLN
jgi:hypothetical protein